MAWSLGSSNNKQRCQVPTNKNENKHMELRAIITPNHEPWHKLWGVSVVGSFSFLSYFLSFFLFSFARRAYETVNKRT
jgi:hypothetical protein